MKITFLEKEYQFFCYLENTSKNRKEGLTNKSGFIKDEIFMKKKKIESFIQINEWIKTKNRQNNQRILFPFWKKRKWILL